ncbi:MAG TPA: glycosyltransferase [Tabrizicola sp.]|nr:glycosyltransferase [Tabrizicola sp.]
MTQPTLGAVAIGRNEGERLKNCLRSLVPHCDRVVYVDSGSSDDSVAFARSLGVTVVELDRDRPFTAARARNAGFEALARTAMPPDLVQFVDGDCTLEAGWLQAGRAHLQSHEALGLVTGWRSEMFPDASVYNSLFQADWHRPAGRIRNCGGDMMVRTVAFQQIGGFNPKVIAAEDDDFCLRLGKAGWELERLPLQMTRHDAAMKDFSAWWRRSIRDGHGFAQVGDLHPEYFRRERLRGWIYGLALPAIFWIGILVWPWLALAVALIYGVSFLRTLQGYAGRAPVKRRLLGQVALLTLSKIPNVIGMLTYYLHRRAGKDMHIIEYKQDRR